MHNKNLTIRNNEYSFPHLDCRINDGIIESFEFDDSKFTRSVESDAEAPIFKHRKLFFQGEGIDRKTIEHICLNIEEEYEDARRHSLAMNSTFGLI
jgi:hypothetical protein